MPRRARIAVPGIPWHIIQRGNNRSACFFSDSDYECYLSTLEEQAGMHRCAVHAYVLMTNHVHLLVTPERRDSAALMMKNLGQRYVQYINRTYRRSGTLWEGRFKSCLAMEEAYVLTCYRYIELNPVRAKMVESPGDYPWSSYGYNAAGKASSLLTPHRHYLGLGENNIARQENYRSLVSLDLDPEKVREVRSATNGNFALGSSCFQEQIGETLGRRVVPGVSGRPRKDN